jgi:hypothetical protein
MKENPRNPEAHEAKRKAGWYSAVALWVFEVDSAAVISAVRSASEREPAAVVQLARRCRKAPENWREQEITLQSSSLAVAGYSGWQPEAAAIVLTPAQQE